MDPNYSVLLDHGEDDGGKCFQRDGKESKGGKNNKTLYLAIFLSVGLAAVAIGVSLFIYHK